MMMSITSGVAKPIDGLQADDFPYQWSSDGTSLFIRRVGAFPVTISEFDLATKTRRAIATITTRDPNGVDGVSALQSTPDGKIHAYSYLRGLTSTLYVVDGLR